MPLDGIFLHQLTQELSAALVGGRVDRACAGEIVLTWLCTFPACGALGYLLVRAFA